MTTLSLRQSDIDACCGARRWQALMGAAGVTRAGHAELLGASERAFDALSREEWLEAICAHAEIGAARASDPVGASEQAGMRDAGPELRAELASASAAYRERFGFGFLIRARGRSPEEILAALGARLEHPPAVEFATACAQQREITALRLERLLTEAR